MKAYMYLLDLLVVCVFCVALGELSAAQPVEKKGEEAKEIEMLVGHVFDYLMQGVAAEQVARMVEACRIQSYDIGKLVGLVEQLVAQERSKDVVIQFFLQAANNKEIEQFYVRKNRWSRLSERYFILKVGALAVVLGVIFYLLFRYFKSSRPGVHGAQLVGGGQGPVIICQEESGCAAQAAPLVSPGCAQAIADAVQQAVCQVDQQAAFGVDDIIPAGKQVLSQTKEEVSLQKLQPLVLVNQRNNGLIGLVRHQIEQARSSGLMPAREQALYLPKAQPVERFGETVDDQVVYANKVGLSSDLPPELMEEIT